MSADLLTRLIAAGTPAELVAEVAMLSARADAAAQAIEGRRAKDRARQDRRRHAMSRDITLDNVTTRDVTDEPPPSPSPFLPPDPQPTPAPAHPHANPTRARAAGSFVRPDWADEQIWADFLANRRKKGLTNTATAFRKFLADIDRLTDAAWPPGRLLEAITARGWGALYPSIKDDDDEQRSGRRPQRVGRNDRSDDAHGPSIGAALDWLNDSGPH
ncbi:MAG: hypothetical protein DI530_15050 [Sphingomonas sp.]|nr:MAG: hypothetical protein DI530_15050 [Sphingomonas sp.]